MYNVYLSMVVFAFYIPSIALSLQLWVERLRCCAGCIFETQHAERETQPNSDWINPP